MRGLSRFEADGEAFDVAREDEGKFLEAHPGASRLSSFELESGEVVDVREPDLAAFGKEHPAARPLFSVERSGGEILDVRESDRAEFRRAFRESPEFEADRKENAAKVAEAVRAADAQGAPGTRFGGFMRGFGQGLAERAGEMGDVARAVPGAAAAGAAAGAGAFVGAAGRLIGDNMVGRAVAGFGDEVNEGAALMAEDVRRALDERRAARKGEERSVVDDFIPRKRTAGEVAGDFVLDGATTAGWLASIGLLSRGVGGAAGAAGMTATQAAKIAGLSQIAVFVDSGREAARKAALAAGKSEAEAERDGSISGAVDGALMALMGGFGMKAPSHPVLRAFEPVRAQALRIAKRAGVGAAWGYVLGAASDVAHQNAEGVEPLKWDLDRANAAGLQSGGLMGLSAAFGQIRREVAEEPTKARFREFDNRMRELYERGMRERQTKIPEQAARPTEAPPAPEQAARPEAPPMPRTAGEALGLSPAQAADMAARAAEAAKAPSPAEQALAPRPPALERSARPETRQPRLPTPEQPRLPTTQEPDTSYSSHPLSPAETESFAKAIKEYDANSLILLHAKTFDERQGLIEEELLSRGYVYGPLARPNGSVTYRWHPKNNNEWRPVNIGNLGAEGSVAEAALAQPEAIATTENTEAAENVQPFNPSASQPAAQPAGVAPAPENGIIENAVDGAGTGREYDYIDAIADGNITGRFTQKEAETLNETGHQGLRNLITSLDRAGASPEGEGGAAGEGGDGGGQGFLGEVAELSPQDPAVGDRYLGEGSESKVFEDATSGRAVKIRPIPGADRAALREQLDALARHNALFPKDAYAARIVSFKGDDGRVNYYLRLTQPLVRPLRDADGYTAKPTEEQIVAELMKIRQDWVFHGTLDEAATDTGGDSGKVGADRFMAVCPDYVVTDFKPGENTFIDEETGEVRFIDPRILRNSPNAGIAPEAPSPSQPPAQGRADAGATGDIGDDVREIIGRATGKGENERPADATGGASKVSRPHMVSPATNDRWGAMPGRPQTDGNIISRDEADIDAAIKADASGPGISAKVREAGRANLKASPNAKVDGGGKSASIIYSPSDGTAPFRVNAHSFTHGVRGASKADNLRVGARVGDVLDASIALSERTADARFRMARVLLGGEEAFVLFTISQKDGSLSGVEVLKGWNTKREAAKRASTESARTFAASEGKPEGDKNVSAASGGRSMPFEISQISISQADSVWQAKFKPGLEKHNAAKGRKTVWTQDGRAGALADAAPEGGGIGPEQAALPAPQPAPEPQSGSPEERESLEYRQRYGNTISGDNARQMLGADPARPETHAAYSRDVARIVENQFSALLGRLRGGGTPQEVVFLGGGNGAGKSTVAAMFGDAAGILDSTMSDHDSTADKINRVIDAGGRPLLAFVWRNPADAWRGVQDRMSEGGHGVTEASFRRSHERSRETFLSLLREFGDKIDYVIFENDGRGAPREISAEELAAKPGLEQGVEHGHRGEEGISAAAENGIPGEVLGARPGEPAQGPGEVGATQGGPEGLAQEPAPEAQPPAPETPEPPAGGTPGDMPEGPRGGPMEKPESRLDWFRRKIQDAMLPVKRLMDEFGAAPDDDVYLAAAARYGKDEHQTRELFRTEVSPVLDECARLGLRTSSLSAYLMARFAPERNRMVADRTAGVKSAGSGLSAAAARSILKHYRKTGEAARLEAVAEMVWRMNRDTLGRLVESGLLSKAQADKWMELSPHYVPLRTMLDEEDGGGGVSAAITRLESKHALGRTTLADNPLVFSILQAEQAVVRANKNEVRRKLAAFVRAHPECGFVLEGRPKRESLVDGTVRWAEDFSFREKAGPGDVGGRDNVVQFKEGGDLKYVVLYGERGALVARAVTGSGMAGLPGKIGETATRVGRYVANTRTSWSPTFLLRNLFCDGQAVAATMNMDGLHRPSALCAKFVGSGAAYRAAAAYFADGSAAGELGPYMAEAAENGMLVKGGTSQGWDETTRFIEARLREKASEGGRGLPVRAARMVRGLVARLGRVNSAVEVQTRLAVYAALRKPVEEGGAGWGVAESVAYARDVTVDFNRKGELGQFVSIWWMFANASIQDIERTIRSFRGDEARRHGSKDGAWKSRAATIAALAALGVFQGLDWGGGDDDDGEAGDVTEYAKQTSWRKRLGKNSRHYLRLGRRGPYGLIPYAAEKMTEVVFGRTSADDAASDIAEFAWGLALDPVSGGGQIMRGRDGRSIDVADTALNALAPWFGVPLVQAATDRDFTGAPLTGKRYNENLPASWNGRESTASPYKAVARFVNRATGGDKFTPGRLDLPPEYYALIVNTLVGGLGSDIARAAGTVQDLAAGEFAPERIPFVRDFVREVPDNTRRYWEARARQGGYETAARGWRADGDAARAAEVEARHPSAKRGVSAQLRKRAEQIKNLREQEARLTGPASERARQLRTKLQSEYIELVGK